MEVTLSNLRRETGELELRWEEYRRQKVRVWAVGLGAEILRRCANGLFPPTQALLQKSQTEFQRDKDACEEEKLESRAGLEGGMWC